MNKSYKRHNFELQVLCLSIGFLSLGHFAFLMAEDQAKNVKAAESVTETGSESFNRLPPTSKAPAKSQAVAPAKPNDQITLALSAQRLESVLKDLDNPDPLLQDKAIAQLKKIASKLSELADNQGQNRQAVLARHMELTAYNALTQRARRSRSNVETTYNVGLLRGAAQKTGRLSSVDAKRLSLFWTLQADLIDLQEAAPPRQQELRKSVVLIDKTLKAFKLLDSEQSSRSNKRMDGDGSLTKSMEKHLRLSLLKLLDELGDSQNLKQQLAYVNAADIRNPLDKSFVEEAKHYQSLLGKKLLLDLQLDQGKRYKSQNSYGFSRAKNSVQIKRNYAVKEKGLTSPKQEEEKNQQATKKGQQTQLGQSGPQGQHGPHANQNNDASQPKTLLYFLSVSDSKSSEILKKLERMKRQLALKGIQLIPIYAQENGNTQTKSLQDDKLPAYREATSNLKLTQLLGIKSLPRFVVLNDDGRIIQIAGSSEGIDILDQ